jgi:predicted RNA binding protein YcfA (HicA-like mRNA interferase family)
MSKFEKLVEKILNGKNISYQEAENVLLSLGFQLRTRGSHHNFRKQGYHKTISIKKRTQLFDYQVDDLKEVLRDHEYN